MFSQRWKREPRQTTIASATNSKIVEIEAGDQIYTTNTDDLPSKDTWSEIDIESTSKITISNENVEKETSDGHEIVDEVPSKNVELPANDASAKSDAIEMESIAIEISSSPPPPPSPQPEQAKKLTTAPVECRPPQKGCYLDNSKLDEIASIEDVRHTIIECREPNGTTYFVEASTTAATEADRPNVGSDDTTITTAAAANPSAQLYELSELDKIELERNMLERVLNQIDIHVDRQQSPAIDSESPPAVVAAAVATSDDFISDDYSIEDEREVRAIVHATNSYFNSPMYTPPPTPITPPSPPPTPPPKPKLFAESKQHTVPTPNFRIETYETMPAHKLLYENDQSRREFKLRLESLFKQNDESRAPATRFISPVLRHKQRISPHNVHLNHSMSAPESLVIASATDADDDDIAESTEKHSVPLSLPTPLILLPPPIGTSSPSKIPSAPVFNQQLYDTIGRRNRPSLTVASGDRIDIDDSNTKKHTSKSAPQTLQKSSLQRAKAHENLAQLDNDGTSNNGDSSKNDEIPNIAAIRKKLENIFSKGRTAQADVTDLELNQNENVRHSKRHELIDTVRMQKMRFNSVLKSIESIGSDVHANLHPTNTAAANDIQQEIKRRESMPEVQVEPMTSEANEHHDLPNDIDNDETTTIPTTNESIA